jgi:hypothetical protein
MEHAMPDPVSPELFQAMTEIAALQMVVMSLIRSHPDREKMKSEFHSVTTRMQIGAAVSGDVDVPMPAALRAALARYAQLIDGMLP